MKQFQSIKVEKPGRNMIDLSHEVKMTGNMGQLLPFMCMEVVPGDSFTNNSEVLLRLQPTLAPIMHRVDVYTHFFFVPNRIIWDDWEEFITGGEDGLSVVTPPAIVMMSPNQPQFAEYRLGDYLGIPPMPTVGVTGAKDISALPFRAYQKIYNEYYRDQNLITPVNYETGTLTELTEIRTRAWQKDYFTSALPWAQRGGDVSLSLGTSAPIDYVAGQYNQVRNRILGTTYNNLNENLQTDATGDIVDISANDLNIDNSSSLSADLSSATAGTIADLRVAVAVQRWLEKNARGGSRYIEMILSHFGVTSSDARLQRPEYLGGGRQPVVISEVLSTVEAVGAPQGQMTGHGLSIGKTNRFKRYFEEHGFIMGIISVMPKPQYQDGLHKMFTRWDKLDYYWPEFAQLGEQEVQDPELYLDFTDLTAAGTFGYQARYQEYKYAANRVAGDMRTTLEYWHLGRKFASPPALNQSFVECTPSHRVFAVTAVDEHKLIFQIWNSVYAERPMPFFNIPTI